MAHFNNRTKAKFNATGEVIRQKLPGFSSLLMAYGQCLFLEHPSAENRNASVKAYFLLTSFASATGDSWPPGLVRKLPAYQGITNELMPYSKKFGVSDELAKILIPGNEYWFSFSSTPVSKPIDGNLITYEDLNLVHLADAPGVGGFKSVCEGLRLVGAA
ncbi:MAG TPA: hypothetical protein VK211_23820 [Kamptonema sp.]|nr:hypothetical protein [Kamptonema sp.]